jgi:hypothetical protein
MEVILVITIVLVNDDAISLVLANLIGIKSVVKAETVVFI